MIPALLLLNSKDPESVVLLLTDNVLAIVTIPAIVVFAPVMLTLEETFSLPPPIAVLVDEIDVLTPVALTFDVILRVPPATVVFEDEILVFTAVTYTLETMLRVPPSISVLVELM